MNSRNVIFRLSVTEKQQLQQLAEREGDTVSELIREALYRRYGIGSIGVNSPSAVATDGVCNAPRQ